jgi:hypothetical protein
MKEMNSENCGPGCDCGKPSRNKKIKVAVCLIVLLAVGGVFAYRAKNGKQSAPANTETAFTAPVASGVSQQKPDTAVKVIESKEAVQPIDEQKPAVNAVEEGKMAGVSLDSLASLNKVAMNQDAVFIFVPAKGLNFASKEDIDAIASAQKKIESIGAKIGLYTLQSSSTDYANIASQVTPPCMLVMSKGKGTGAVSGGITEDKILQAYVTSSRAGGCGPSGCGSSSAGCGPSSPAPAPKLK